MRKKFKPDHTAYTPEQKKRYNSILKIMKAIKAGKVNKKAAADFILGIPAEDMPLFVDAVRVLNISHAEARKPERGLGA